MALNNRPRTSEAIENSPVFFFSFFFVSMFSEEEEIYYDRTIKRNSCLTNHNHHDWVPASRI